MYLTLPIPTGRGTSKLSLQQCLDAFVKEEVMDKSDAWCVPATPFPRLIADTRSLGIVPIAKLSGRLRSTCHYLDFLRFFSYT